MTEFYLVKPFFARPHWVGRREDDLGRGGVPRVTLIGQLWAIIDNAVGVGSEERCELH